MNEDILSELVKETEALGGYCQYNDCGWCYHPRVHKDYSDNFIACSGLEKCPFERENEIYCI